MARVSSNDVLAIMDVDTSIADLSPFIAVANLLVNEKLSASGLSNDLLKEIERWLAAHFVAIRDPRAKSESIGGISVSYFGREGEGLKSTLYGQQAIALDITGSLAKSGMKQATISAVEWSQD